MAQTLAIIGGGPKAAAIIAKCDVLRRNNFTVPDVKIYEKDQLGAAWRAGSGFTDGEQFLCTPAERDLGFPYDRAAFSRKPGTSDGIIARQMLADYSWQKFCVVQGLDNYRYDNWLMKGRKPPSHAMYADYLAWAITKAGPNAWLREEVVDIRHTGGAWQITSQGSGGNQTVQDFDIVVVTGSGVPKNKLPGHNGRVFNAVEFWTQPLNIVNLLMAGGGRIGIIGSGGAAAAIAAWLVSNGLLSHPIRIIGKETHLTTRSFGYFTDRVYTDDNYWASLDPSQRTDFVNRVNNGAVWESVMSILERAPRIEYRSGYVNQYVPDASALPGTPGPPLLVAKTARGDYDAAVFIEAIGLNTRSFERLFHGHHALATPIYVNRHFEIVDPNFPGQFHAPMLGDKIGPAAINLMALGWMADRMLRPYVK